MDGHRFRKDERVPVDLPCDITIGTDTVAGKISNLGLGGLQLSASQPLQQDESVEVAFSLDPNGPRMELQAHIQWCRPQGESWVAGLAFLDPPGQDLVELAQWLAQVPKTTDLPQ